MFNPKAFHLRRVPETDNSVGKQENTNLSEAFPPLPVDFVPWGAGMCDSRARNEAYQEPLGCAFTLVVHGVIDTFGLTL
jgi:hypothetical protein